MDYLRGPLMNIAKKVNWIPGFCLERELDWLKNMRDWLISKKRYWGLALPIYECPKCKNFDVIGSFDELKQRAVAGWKDFEGNSPHRPWIDKVKIQCSKCNEVVSRILDVGNPWLDAGVVPFSTISEDNRSENIPYFHNNRAEWDKWFPIDLVCESFPGQFKNWFYVLLVMSQVLENKTPFKNLLGFASVVDEKGEEMHKSKGNAIWFDEAAEKIGADVMRWMYAVQNPANNMRFGYNVAKETERKILTLTNCVRFFETYGDKPKVKSQKSKIQDKNKNLLDGWILSRLNNLISETTENLEKFDVAKAALAVENFWINDLSLWYVRRSRKRFQDNENLEDKEQGEQAFYKVLLTVCKLIAPLMPFLAEEIYQQLRAEGDPVSVHLCDWPKAKKKLIDKELEEEMREIRDIVSLALAKRAELGIGVRQALQKVKSQKSKIKSLSQNSKLLELIKDEVNVKEVEFIDNLKEGVELDTAITNELKQEGIIREIVRNIQSLRKKAGLTPSDTDVAISYFANEKLIKILKENQKQILQSTRSKELKENKEKQGEFLSQSEFNIDEEIIWLALEK